MTTARSAFTLIELLVVVLIISILATVVGVYVLDMPGQARVSAAKAQVGAFDVALERYYVAHGGFPTEEQGLAALCREPTSSPVPENYPDSGYLKTLEIPKDQWGNEYVYSVPGPEGRPYEIVSYGADGEPGGEGTDADISSLAL
jgi:general secretion pathway protein G